MNIQQMHVEVNLSSQKIGSNVKRKFIPEEIDWILNKMIGRFIKNKIKPDEQTRQGGFQNDSIDLNALRTLVVTDLPLDVYKKSASDEFVSAELPGDYAYLIEDHSGVVRDCHDTYITASKFTAANEYVCLVKVNKSEKNTKPYYVTPKLYVNGVYTVKSESFPANLPDKEMNFVLIDVIKNELLNNREGYQVYWEHYKNLFKPDTFIFVSKSPITQIDLVFDNTVLINTPVITTPFFSGTSASKGSVANRLIRNGNVRDLLQSTFSKSRWDSPISAIQGNTLKVYHDTTFIVNNLKVNYIRKPKSVSLSLGSGCDLPEEFHPDICDWAVEYIKQAINDPNYQWKLGDNQLRRE